MGRQARNHTPPSLYRELPPLPSLAPYLACVWVRETSGTDLRARVVPDGCIDIVWRGAAGLSIAGPATLPVFPDLPLHDNIVGARFRPGTAPCLLGIPSHELLDQDVPLEAVWGRATDALRDAAAGSGAATVKLDLLQEALAARLREAAPADDLVRVGVALLAGRASARVGELANVLGVSERHLLRRFRVAVGYGPKTLDRVLRFQRALKLLRRSVDGPGLAEVAGVAGYADQAHMTREFALLAGAPPSHLSSDN